MAGAMANTMQQQQNGGRPGEGGMQEPRTEDQGMKADAQPTNLGMRGAENRNG